MSEPSRSPESAIPTARSAIRAFAPATVSNVGCGFDALGFAVDQPGDVVEAKAGPGRGITIRKITGDGGRLPRDAQANTAGVAVAELLRATGCQRGVELILEKGLPLGSGLGSSAASGVAALVAVDHLFGLGASRDLLLRCAMEAERVACGSAHPDNAAPSIWGGLVLIRRDREPEVVALPVPEGLACAIVHPHVEVSTRAARELLGETVALGDAVTQWANLGALVAALYRGDLELLSRCLVDSVAEPKRASLVPGLRAAQTAARENGALGAGLSGSGPSIFALAPTLADAERAADAMVTAIAEQGYGSDRLVSMVGTQGARVLD